MSEFSSEHERAAALSGEERDAVAKEAYARYREILSGAERILREGNPARWWHRMYRYLALRRKELGDLPKQYSESIARQFDETLEILRAQPKLGPTGTASDYQTAAQNAIHEIADALHTTPEQWEASPIRGISWETLATRIGSDVRIERRDEQVFVNVRPNAETEWAEFAMPKTGEIVMKGGLPRILLKRIVGAPQNLLAAEFPVNDIDVIADGDDKVTVKQEAMALGADAEGIEWSHAIENLPALFRARDVDLNQCFLTKDGLCYTERAAEAAKTGTIVALASDRGIYGTEDLFFEGIRLVKNRALARLVKFVAEGKATEFDMIPLNRQVPLGIYWLVLARKFMFKKNGPQMLDRMLEIGRQMGQVGPDESMYDVLDRVHAETSFFKFSEGALDEAGVTRWLGYKLQKLSDRLFRTENAMKLGLKFTRDDGDTIPYRVSLAGYVSNPARVEEIREGWQAFVERCDARAKGDVAIESPSEAQVAA